MGGRAVDGVRRRLAVADRSLEDLRPLRRDAGELASQRMLFNRSHHPFKLAVLFPGGVEILLAIDFIAKQHAPAVAMKAEIASLSKFFAGEALPLKLDINEGPTHLQADGSLKQDGLIDMQLSLSEESLSILSKILRINLPQWTNCKFSLHLIKSPSKPLSIKVANFQATLAGMPLHGDVDLTEDKEGTYVINGKLGLAQDHLQTKVYLRQDGSIDLTLDTKLKDFATLSNFGLKDLPPWKNVFFKRKGNCIA